MRRDLVNVTSLDLVVAKAHYFTSWDDNVISSTTLVQTEISQQYLYGLP